MNGIRIRTKLPGPKARRILKKDHAYITPAYTRGYPLVIDQGRDVWVKDVDGNVFLDFTAGVAVNTTGHSHPAIRKVAHDQASRFVHMAGTDFYYDVMADLAERLSRIAPGPGRKQIFLTNSGTEAIEAAMKLARWVTRRPRFLSFLGAFHGRTFGALSLTASKTIHRARFAPMFSETTHLPYAYCYRCPINLEPQTCGAACADWAEQQIFPRSVPPDEVAAVFVEPMQGEGGYIPAPAEFLRKIRAMCDRHGILMVADEIQTGMGRSGRMFMIEHSGVVPDILCTAKGLASGYPIGAMIARAELHQWPSGAHANTFGGNAVACAAAIKTLDLLEGGLVDNAAARGKRLGERLQSMARTYDIVGDARGIGLMWGIEIVRSKSDKQPAPDIRNRIVDRAFHEGLLILPAGPSTVRFIPSLTVKAAHVDAAMDIVERIVRDEQSRLANP